MSKICYVAKDFRPETVAVIEMANKIISEYLAKGFRLTLRQLYYQFVSRTLIPNTERDYKWLGSIINDGRLAGLIDWLAIEDRTRNLAGNQHWDSPAQIVDACVRGYQVDKWFNQPWRVEIFIEKDALVGVISGICRKLDCNYFSCRGYTSASEMWLAGCRLKDYWEKGQKPLVLHFGDHDPSGLDMTRDIRDRLGLFSDRGIFVERIALTMEQIEQYNPSPNPTKLTDSRAEGYISEYGEECWELDALEPQVISDLVEKYVLDVRDEDCWQEALEVEQAGVRRLQEVKNLLEDLDGG